MRQYDADKYLDIIEKRIKEDLNLYSVAIEKYDTNQFAICKKLLRHLEKDPGFNFIVDTCAVWDNENYIATVINIIREYQNFLRQLSEPVRKEIGERVENMVKEYFKIETE